MEADALKARLTLELSAESVEVSSMEIVRPLLWLPALLRPSVKRQQMVYRYLNDSITRGHHVVTITAKAPSER